MFIAYNTAKRGDAQEASGNTVELKTCDVSGEKEKSGAQMKKGGTQETFASRAVLRGFGALLGRQRLFFVCVQG